MFDYVMILASIVIGLALTHLMQGLTGLLEQPDRMRVWWVHLLWVAYMLFLAVFWWWYEYILHNVQRWTFGTYVFVLVEAFLIYMGSALLFPRDPSRYEDWEECFLARRKWFFSAMILSLLLDPIDSALKGQQHLAQLGIEYWVATLVSIAFAAIAIWSPNRRVQGFIAAVSLLYQISWAARLFQTVS